MILLLISRPETDDKTGKVKPHTPYLAPNIQKLMSLFVLKLFSCNTVHLANSSEDWSSANRYQSTKN